MKSPAQEPVHGPGWGETRKNFTFDGGEYGQRPQRGQSESAGPSHGRSPHMPGEGKRFHGGSHVETDPQRARKLPMGQQEAEGESPRVVQEQTATPGVGGVGGRAWAS